MNNCSLSLVYINTAENPADVHSRSLSKSDTTISKRTWVYIEYIYGPHDVHMFALDSNTMTTCEGKPLDHFTPYPSPCTAGVDAFSQIYDSRKIIMLSPFTVYCLRLSRLS